MIGTGLIAGLLIAMSLEVQPMPADTNPPPQVAGTSLFAIVFRAGPSWKPGRPMGDQGLLEHGRYWAGLFKSGRVFSAGRMGEDGGLVLLHARNAAEAEAMLEADPAMASGIFIGEVRPYVPRFLSEEPLRMGGAKAVPPK